jgi:hypothetical protein
MNKYALAVAALVVLGFTPRLHFTLHGQTLQIGSKPDPIEVYLTGDEVSSLAAVTVHDTAGADSMIITVFYWIKYPQLSQEIVMSKTCVQPAYQDVAVASDPVPVPAIKIKSVSVTLVKNVASKKFEYGAAVAQGRQEKP